MAHANSTAVIYNRSGLAKEKSVVKRLSDRTATRYTSGGTAIGYANGTAKRNRNDTATRYTSGGTAIGYANGAAKRSRNNTATRYTSGGTAIGYANGTNSRTDSVDEHSPTHNINPFGSVLPEREPELLLQTQVDKFTFHESLGSGAFGEVFRATDNFTGKEVAVKFMLSDKTERLKQLYSLMEKLPEDEHVMNVYSIEFQSVPDSFLIVVDGSEVVVDANVILVMQYVSGSDMQVLQYSFDGIEDEELILTMLENALDGIIHMHELNMVHRDIKLENFVLNDENGKIVLVDMDMSCQICDSDIDTCIVPCPGYNQGTEEYLSPEQLMGKKHLDLRAVDIWALGVAFYIFCEHKNLPLETQMGGEIHFAHTGQTLQSLIELMLTFHPAQRPSAKQLKTIF